LVINGDVSAGVGDDAGRLETQVVRVRPPAHGQQHVASFDGWRPARAGHTHSDAGRRRGQIDAGRREAELDAFTFEDSLKRGGDILVLARDQAVSLFHDRDAAAEAAVDLRELQSDIAAAHDDQVFGQGLQCQQARVGQDRHAGDARHLRHESAAAHVDEDLVGLEHLVVHRHGVRPGEPAMALEYREVRRVLHPPFHALVGLADDLVLSRAHARQVHGDVGADCESELGSATRHVNGPRAGDERLGRDAAGVDTRPPEPVPFHHGRLAAGFGQPGGEGGAGLPGPDDDGVEDVRGHEASLSGSCVRRARYDSSSTPNTT